MAMPPEGVSPLPYANEDARDKRDMVIASLFTFLYLLLFGFFWISSQTLTALQKKPPENVVRTNLKIQRLAQPPQMAPPMQSQFVDASGLKEVDKPDPRTALQSDRNTAASSKVVNGTDTTLGGQDGKKDDSLTMRDSQFSPNPASPPLRPASAPPLPNPPNNPLNLPLPYPKPNFSSPPPAQAHRSKKPTTPLRQKKIPLNRKMIPHPQPPKPLPTPLTPPRPWHLRPTSFGIEAPFPAGLLWDKMPRSPPWAPPSVATNTNSIWRLAHAGI